MSIQMKTLKVSNLSLRATAQDIKEFFSFSGEIQHVELKSDTESSQVAYVTFKDQQGAETALLLSGSTIDDAPITITPAPDYQLPTISSSSPTGSPIAANVGAAVQKAEDVVTSMVAKGFTLGKDALNKAKAFDEQLQLTSTATAKVVSLDQKIGLSEKITMGTTAVNDKVKEVDQKFHVSEKTKSAIAAAEQTVSNAGSAILNNRYVLTGASWAAGAFSKVAKAAGDVGSKAKEQVVEANEDQKRDNVDESGKVHNLAAN